MGIYGLSLAHSRNTGETSASSLGQARSSAGSRVSGLQFSVRNLGLMLLTAQAGLAMANPFRISASSSWAPSIGGPQYPDAVFDHPEYVQKGNCYSYARNDAWHGSQAPGMVRDMVEGRGQRTLLGTLAWIAPMFTMQCKDIQEGQRKDGAVDAIVKDGGNSICPDGTHLVNSRVAHQMPPFSGTPGMKDFHFVRKNQDGTWTHKMGDQPVTNQDASGKQINNPDTGNFNYGLFSNYKDCDYLCHPDPEKIESDSKPKPKPGERSWADVADDISDAITSTPALMMALGGAYLYVDHLQRQLPENRERAQGDHSRTTAQNVPPTAATHALHGSTSDFDQSRFDSKSEQQVYQWLEFSGAASRTQIKNGMKKELQGGAIEKALTQLKQKKLILEELDHRQGTKKFRVNPSKVA